MFNHQSLVFDTKDASDITTIINLSISSCSIKFRCLAIPLLLPLFKRFLQSVAQAYCKQNMSLRILGLLLLFAFSLKRFIPFLVLLRFGRFNNVVL